MGWNQSAKAGQGLRNLMELLQRVRKRASRALREGGTLDEVHHEDRLGDSEQRPACSKSSRLANTWMGESASDRVLVTHLGKEPRVSLGANREVLQCVRATLAIDRSIDRSSSTRAELLRDAVPQNCATSAVHVGLCRAGTVRERGETRVAPPGRNGPGSRRPRYPSAGGRLKPECPTSPAGYGPDRSAHGPEVR